MNEQNPNYLKEQLQALGFPVRIAEEISHQMKGNKEAFHLYYSNQIDEDELMFDLRFSKQPTHEYQLKEYELTCKHIPIPDLNIQGINTKDLDRKLNEVNALYDKYYGGNIEGSLSRQQYEQGSDFIKATNNALYKLAEAEEGREIAKLLLYKYFPESEYAKAFQDYSEMQKLHEHKRVFPVNGNKALTVAEAYEFLKTNISNKAAAYERLQETAVESALNKTNLFTPKTNVMNQKNFEYLSDQVKYTGFGEELKNNLKEKMQQGTSEFDLIHRTKLGNDAVVAVLHFKKSGQTDMYFFNKYDMALKKEDSQDTMEQTFYINKGNNITFKEAYNLMSGRAVHKDLTNKEGQVYNAWLQMDFKQADNNGNYKIKHYHQNYGFDLEKELAKHPIKELASEEYKSNLMDSIKKGNLQLATFQTNGTEKKQYIEANPQFKTINIYDSSMQRVDNRQSKKERQSEGENQSVKQEGKKERQTPAEEDGPEIPKASKKRKKRQSIS